MLYSFCSTEVSDARLHAAVATGRTAGAGSGVLRGLGDIGGEDMRQTDTRQDDARTKTILMDYRCFSLGSRCDLHITAIMNLVSRQEARALIFDDLRAIQNQYGYLPAEQLEALSQAHRHSAVSHSRRRRFLSALSSVAAAQSEGEVCSDMSCHLRGADRSARCAEAALPG